MKTQIKKTVVAVMLPREHLPFVRGWCEHHLAQGFGVVLYDNTGSTGSARRTSSFAQKGWVRKQVDKRHRPYGRWTQHLTDEEVSQAMRRKLEDLDGVEVREWKPVVGGRIVHGQVEAYADFVRGARTSNIERPTSKDEGEEVHWGAFIDCDEYLEARGGLGWDALLEAAEHCGRVRILGDSWECRWNEDGTPRHVDELRYVEHQGTGGVKNLCRLDMVTHADLHSYWGIRGMDWCYEADPRQFGFRHHANPGKAGVLLKGVKVPGPNGESVAVPAVGGSDAAGGGVPSDR